ncbi:hypothetical protein [Kutzneria sp. 744]|uniref:hypothetical protein n=1 Tax=Kutzneria sp. (strain 744) TaxID=345341 RepID=UPI0004B3F308|nr:hypothetical protein [Kutzneria sp. 744]
MTIDERPAAGPDDRKPDSWARTLAALVTATDSWARWLRFLLLIVVVGLMVFAAVHYLHLHITVGPLKIMENTRTGS